MANLIKIENAIWSFFVPINERLAPTTENLRYVIIDKFYDPTNEPGPDMAERFYVGYRIMDLINKTELRCFFISSVEWYTDYSTLGTQSLKVSLDTVLPLKNKILKLGRRELLNLGVPEPTIMTVQKFIKSEDPVNVVSGMCAHVFLACLNNLGNRSLDKN